MDLLLVSRVGLLIIGSVVVVGCGDETPDGDVQYRCAGEHADELCAHAGNAAAELQPHVAYQIVVSDPETTGVTWRSADQWTIRSVPTGYRLPAANLTDPDTVLCGGGPLAATHYPRRTIYVGACTWSEEGWDLGSVVRHEIGHSLGVSGHAGHGLIMAPDLEWETGPQEYDAADIEMIASVRRGESNDILEAIWID